MKIALIGYGKMGKAIEEEAMKRGHEIVLKIASGNRYELTIENLKKADVAIEFTNPIVAMQNVSVCLKAGTKVVCGTTGWNTYFSEAEKIALEYESALVISSNFSVGMNLFFELNRTLAKLMKSRNNYKVSIEETHHSQKKDAPSGTAISLANQIINEQPELTGWQLTENVKPEIIPIAAHRMGTVPGTHLVKYASDIDDIEIIHTAHNRAGFALGAMLAAEFIENKKGVFTMKDVLDIG